MTQACRIVLFTFRQCRDSIIIFNYQFDTIVTQCKESYARQLFKARDVVRDSGVVAYPTESCYGLGCHPKNYKAIRKILALKKRPATKGMILIANDITQLRGYFAVLPDNLLFKLSSSWPSSTTWLVPAACWVPSWIKGDSDKIAVRIPAHRLARQLCKYCGHALVSTSANQSGQRAARSGAQVKRIFSNQVDYVVDAKCGSASQPSTIIDLLTDQILRQGN